MSLNHWFDMNTYKDIMDKYTSTHEETKPQAESTTKATESSSTSNKTISSTEPLSTISNILPISTKTSTVVSSTVKTSKQNEIKTDANTESANTKDDKDIEKEIVPDGRQVNLNVGVSANKDGEAITEQSKNKEDNKDTNAQSDFIDALAKSGSSTKKTSTTKKPTTTLKQKGKSAENTVSNTKSTTVFSSKTGSITTSIVSSSLLRLENQTLTTNTTGPLVSALNSQSAKSVPYSAAGSLLIGLVILAVIETLCIVVLLVCRLKKKGSVGAINENITTNSTKQGQNLEIFDTSQYTYPVDTCGEDCLHPSDPRLQEGTTTKGAQKNTKISKTESVSSVASSIVDRYVEEIKNKLRRPNTFGGNSRTKEHQTRPHKTV